MGVQALGAKKTQRETDLFAEYVFYAGCLAIGTSSVLRL